MLVIAGFAKCGTTSLFSHLSQHPEICGSTVKETGFFVPTEEIRRERRHPFPPIRFEDGWPAYTKYFRDAERPVWLEATNYARFAASAKNLRLLCPNAKLIFLVRNPLEQALSAYRFRQLVGTLSHHLSFEEYVERESKVGPHLSFGMGDLVLCQYSRFVEPFFATFPSSQLKLVGFHDLVRNAPSVVKDICRWVGIDERPVEAFDLAPENVTYHPRSWWVHGTYNFFRRRVWMLRRYFPRAVDRFTGLHQRTGGKLYRRWSAPRLSAQIIRPSTKDRFATIYQTEAEALFRLSGRTGLLEPLRPAAD